MKEMGTGIGTGLWENDMCQGFYSVRVHSHHRGGQLLLSILVNRKLLVSYSISRDVCYKNIFFSIISVNPFLTF